MHPDGSVTAEAPSCSYRKIAFEDINVFGQDGELNPEPNWRDNINAIYPYHPNITPQCGYSVTTTDKRITLTY